MNENSKKILIANIAIVAIIAVAVVGVTYAWFSTTAEDTGSVTVTSGTLSIRYDQGLKIEASNLKPATDTQVLICLYLRETVNIIMKHIMNKFVMQIHLL